MTEKSSSQVHNDGANSQTRASQSAASQNQAPQMADPFAAWKSMTREGMDRFEAMLAETDRMEAESLERTKLAIAESSRLAMESMVWATRLSAEWRKLVLGGLSRSAAGAGPAAFSGRSATAG